MKDHKIVHMEIPMTDLNKAKDFYEKIFDWEIALQTGYEDYAFFKDAEDGIGGAFQKSDKPLEEAMLYINVSDITQILAEIEDAGGKKIQEKTKISDEHGYYAIFEDTCGNQMGLWSRN